MAQPIDHHDQTRTPDVDSNLVTAFGLLSGYGLFFGFGMTMTGLFSGPYILWPGVGHVLLGILSGVVVNRLPGRSRSTWRLACSIAVVIVAFMTTATIGIICHGEPVGSLFPAIFGLLGAAVLYRLVRVRHAFNQSRDSTS